MAYPSFKRVVRETSLERKCLLAFGATLAILIGVAFLCVHQVAVGHVRDTTRQAARHWATTELLNLHWAAWDTDKRTVNLRNQLARDLLNESNESNVADILTLHDQNRFVYLPSTPTPMDPVETAYVERLYERYQAQLAELRAAAAGNSGAAADVAEVEPVFEEREVRADVQGEIVEHYYYYQPVYWKDRCIYCHSRLQGDVFPASEPVSADVTSPPFRVVRVIMPYKSTKKAIRWTQAILWTTAITTGFLSMVGLYLIVKFVIVKPLAHLRDVSDEISRGNTQLRADLNTNDEFQELADAFNRMLRHLTDAQAELEDVNRELDAKVDELAQLNMQLYEMNRLKDDFLANMSHELRTPLNSIIGFSEVLQGIESLDDRQRRYARNIQKSGRLLLDMINDILDLAKMEAGKMEVRLSEFRLDLIVGAQCDMVRSLVENKNIDLSCDVQTDLPMLYQDQAKLQQILTNLLSNAIKFTPEGGRIKVAAGRNRAGQLEMTVADTGVGIPESDCEIIFEKFRQSSRVTGEDGLTREYSGTGLGLSIVKELCKLLGGEITFESELGKGSTFIVVMPWVRADRPRRESEPATLQLVTGNRSTA